MEKFTFSIFNDLAGVMNSLMLIMSVPIITVACFSFAHSLTCDYVVASAILVVGIALLLASLIGIARVGYFRQLSVLRVYAWVLAGVILGILVFTATGFVLINKGAAARHGKQKAGVDIEGEGFRVGDFSDWLRTKASDRKWLPFKKCLIEKKLCTENDKMNHPMSLRKPLRVPYQTSCCMPPEQCRFIQENDSFWVISRSGQHITNQNCMGWNNNLDTLCLNCEGCKAVFLSRTERHLFTILILAFPLLVFLIINLVATIRTYRKCVNFERYTEFRDVILEKVHDCPPRIPYL